MFIGQNWFWTSSSNWAENSQAGEVQRLLYDFYLVWLKFKMADPIWRTNIAIYEEFHFKFNNGIFLKILYTKFPSNLESKFKIADTTFQRIVSLWNDLIQTGKLNNSEASD